MTEPDPEVDAVLAGQLGSLAGTASLWVGGPAAGTAAWTAKRLKTETASEEHTFDPERGNELVQSLARMLDSAPEFGTPGERNGPVTIRGIIGSGFFGMNPSYVLAVVDLDRGKLAVAAHAKEGLIKQHSAEKAVRKLIVGIPLG